ncbi:Mitogen-activated protein kinase kinase kinase [Trema orientale]|uniref:Mitogen-activated protein kinase kinase kinase n=1 Tax=Trema orientale TaxID=63057 RepID=A0A2P5CB95_TREOI|nr:Mitogen-activated protein kinase kinase kinase [Trema orientale]
MQNYRLIKGYNCRWKFDAYKWFLHGTLVLVSILIKFREAEIIPKDGMMDQSRTNKQYQYNSIEPGNNEAFQSSSQTFISDTHSSIRGSMRSPNPNIAEVKPGLNYSLQTGEEFALEFIRDRVNQWKPLLPNAVGDPNYATGYMELKGILGISHTGSESGSDISMLTANEKGPAQYERKNSSAHEDRSIYASVQSVPQMSSGYESSRGVNHGYVSSGASGSSSLKMKVLCSFGGKIIPRPSDGKLRYVGGETRIVGIRKDISWQELTQKLFSIYNQTHVIKYQLPGEDLDALVSVSCDEDLQNMMEECNELGTREGSQKLRIFLFSMSDLEDAQFGLSRMDGDSDVQYVVAVNGMDLGSRKDSNVRGFPSSSASNLGVLDRQNIEKEKNMTAVGPAGVSNMGLTNNTVSSSISQSSVPVIPSSSNAYENHPHFYHGAIMHHGENIDNPLHNGHVTSSYSPFVEVSGSMPLHENMDQQGFSTVGQSISGLIVENLEVPVKHVKVNSDGSAKPASNPEKVFPLGKEYVAPSQPYDNNSAGYIPMEEASITAQDDGQRSLSSKNVGRCQEPRNIAPLIDSANPQQVSKLSEDDHHSTSGAAFAPGYVRSDSTVSDQSYPEPPVLPQRVFYSEKIPREQVDELLNRLSKSDDSHGSQFVISHPRSDTTHQCPITDEQNKLEKDGNLPPKTEHSFSTAKPLPVDTHTVDDGLSRLQKYKEFADSVCQMNAELLQNMDGELKLAVPNPVDNKDVVKEDSTVKADQEAVSSINGHENPKPTSEHPDGSQITSVEHPVDPAHNHQEHDFHVPTENATPSTGISASMQGDILIDIEDRFPRDLLSDIFSKAILSKDSPGIDLLHKDGPGLSLNVENREPKRWSYFQKLAQEGFVQKDFSLMDQDLDFSSALGKDGVDPPTGVPTDGISQDHVDPQLKFGEENHIELSGPTVADSTLHPNYDHSQAKDTESMQFGRMMDNLRMQDSEYEDGNFHTRNVGLPPLDPSLGDFDISTLQAIKDEDLEELRELGSGTFGTVYHGKWRGTDVAIKRIKKSCFTGRSSEQERLTIEFWREADILSKLHHPNVVAFYGVVQDGPGGTLATVTEFMVDGSLRHVLLRKDRYLDRRKRLIIAMDAAFGMEYLHSKNIVHFDLKCDNLLVNLKDPLRPICKVGDFGLSKIKRNTLVSGGVRGTLPWMAPELLNGSSNKVSEKVDVFSFGIVLWEILTGEEPYANMHYGAIIGGIVNNTLRPTIPSYCDSEWRTLMEECWAPNPLARPSFTEIASRLREMSAAAASQAKAQAQKPSK